MNKNTKSKQTYNLIMDLGTELTNHNHNWSNKLRTRFNKVISFLKEK